MDKRQAGPSRGCARTIKQPQKHLKFFIRYHHDAASVTIGVEFPVFILQARNFPTAIVAD